MFENAKNWKHTIWLAANAALAFALPYLLINMMKLSNEAYYIALYIISAAFVFVYARYSGLKWLSSIKPGWALGTIMGVFFGLVFLSLASTSKPTVEESYFSVAMLPFVWRGLLYGLASAALISVLPFMMVWRSFAGTNPGSIRKFGVTLTAAVAIALMSFFYNLGIANFNQTDLKNQMGKNMIASIPTIISGSPLAAPITNVFLQVSESIASSSHESNLGKIEQNKSGGIN